jgi:multidrug resistance protein, MATE family
LRNAMVIASAIGIVGLWILGNSANNTLAWIWIMIGIWNLTRGLFGMLRIWPGVGKSIFQEKSHPSQSLKNIEK